MDDANYDDLAALVRHKAMAEAVVMFVVGGKRGSGTAVVVKGHTLSEGEKESLMMDLFQKQGAAALQGSLGVAPRDIAPAEGEIKGLPKMQHHRYPSDSDDQVLLRETVGDELEAVCKKYDVGGAFTLVSRECAAWRSVFPSWCGLQPDPVTVLRVRMSSKTPEDARNADSTMHFIGAVRELASDYASLYGRIWRQVADTLKSQGATIEHRNLARADAVGGRPDPLGGKVQ